MTQLTSLEIKIVSFGVTFLAIVGLFVAIYSQNPIQEQEYQGETKIGISTSPTQSSWISGLIGALPSPFNDANLLIVTSVFISPIIVMLSYIGLRALKDLVTQWIYCWRWCWCWCSTSSTTRSVNENIIICPPGQSNI